MNLNHVAIRPARDMIGEQVYARRWLEFANKECADGRTEFWHVLQAYPYPLDQRAASVAASFITWLGTNVGASFLETANDFKFSRCILSYAYVAAWSVINVRSLGTNSNARQIEFLTRTPEELEKNVFSEVSVRDLEVIDQIALWLGTDDGQEFLSECQKEIVRRYDLESYTTLVAQGRGSSLRARQLATKIAAL
jgi:hypothetical protein